MLTAFRNGKRVKNALRVTLGLGLAVYLIHFTIKSTGGNVIGEMLGARKSLLGLASLLYGVILGITVYRWNLLLRVQGVRLTARDLTRLTLIGVFFNVALPGAVSGDFMKMVLLRQHARDRRVEAMLTVLLDRVVGLFGLFLLASAIVLLYLPFLVSLGPENRPLQIASFIVGIGSFGGVLGFLMLEFRQHIVQHRWIALLLRLSAKKLPPAIVCMMERLTAALDLYRKSRGAVLASLGLSLLVHSGLAIDLYCIGAAVGEHALRLTDYYLIAQVSNAVAAVPVTPGGFGIRDTVTALFFEALKAPPEKSGVIPVIMTLVIILWGIVGSVVFTLTKTSREATFAPEFTPPHLACTPVRLPKGNQSQSSLAPPRAVRNP